MYLELLKRSGRLVLLSFVASVLAAGSAVLLINFVNTFASAAAPARNALVLFFALLGALLLSSVLSSSASAYLSTSLVHDLRLILQRNILSANYQSLSKAGLHRLYNVLTGDVSAIATALSEFPTFLFNATVIVFCMVYMATLSSFLFSVFAGGFLAVLTVSLLLSRRSFKYAMAARRESDHIIDGYKGLIYGSKELQMNGPFRRFFYQDVLVRTSAAFRAKKRAYEMNWGLNQSFSQTLFFLILGLLILMKRETDTAVAAQFLLVVAYCVNPFVHLLFSLELFSAAWSSYRRILEVNLGNGPAAPLAERDAPQAFDSWNELIVKDLCYTYDGNGFKLGPVSHRFRRGDCTFIIGGNGSGKSSFIHVLTGLVTPDSGGFLLDGTPIDASNEQAFRNKFCVCFAEFHLFKRIGPAGDARDTEKVRRLLELFQLADKVSYDRGEYSTLDLSQGQKKRLLLVTQLAYDREIYIFDEWAADQDPHFREVFYRKILPDLKQQHKTVIAVTHDDKYFAAADRILQFSEGRLINVRPARTETAEVVYEGHAGAL